MVRILQTRVRSILPMANGAGTGESQTAGHDKQACVYFIGGAWRPSVDRPPLLTTELKPFDGTVPRPGGRGRSQARDGKAMEDCAWGVVGWIQA
jgi:hypothetical protein